jgi:DNA adenine methylase
MEDLTDRILMIEIDPDVAAVWNVILKGNYKELIKRIINFRISRETAIESLSVQPQNEIDRAFQTILRNRVQRGGILAPGASLVKNGENGRGVASMWYPITLAHRIEAIAIVRDRIDFREGDALGILPHYLGLKSCAFFVDPLYAAGGKRAGTRLYAHNHVDHLALFGLMQRARGEVLLTCDDAAEVQMLAKQHGFCIEAAPMANTHRSLLFELLITNRPLSYSPPPQSQMEAEFRDDIRDKSPSGRTRFSSRPRSQRLSRSKSKGAERHATTPT